MRHWKAVPVKLPYVEYEAPATVAEAVDLLAEHQDEASVLAGGQSLIPLLALRLARPAVLIDVNGLGELSGVSVSDGWVAVGAMTREYVAEESETVADAVPLLAAALPLIGHEAIRNRGTIGGSLAHADPAAELPAVARALDAQLVVRSRAGDRVVPAADWFEGYLTTARRPDEILVEVRFPAAGPGTRCCLPGGRPAPWGLCHRRPGGVADDCRWGDQRCPAGVFRRCGCSSPAGRRGGSSRRREAVAGVVRRRRPAGLPTVSTHLPTCMDRRSTGRRSRPRWSVAGCRRPRNASSPSRRKTALVNTAPVKTMPTRGSDRWWTSP